MRHAARRLLRDWRFTSAAVLILSLGIGTTTAIFSVVNATLFRPSPFADPDRLVEIYQNDSEGRPATASYPAYLDIAAYTNVFAGTTAVSIPNGVSYLDRGAVRNGTVEYATASYPSVLGLRPSLGRWFEASEDRLGAPVVVVLGHLTWSTRFGADPSVVGRTIRIEGVTASVVGVGPEEHRGTLNIGLVTDFWLPLSSLPAISGGTSRMLERRDTGPFFVKARLRDGVTVPQAQAAMAILGSRLAAEYPKEDSGKGITVMASRDVHVHPQMDVIIVTLASLLLGILALVLAIACSNLATLLLVRASARAKEVSIRLAMGATRGQLIRHLLTESMLLSAAGGVAGCVLAWWIIRSLTAIELPITVDLRLDGAVLGFAVGLSLITGVLFGLAPAFNATRVDLRSTLREDTQTGPGHRRLTLKNALVVFQVTVSVVLLATTGVFLEMVTAARAQPVGFAVDGIAMLEIDVRSAGYSAERSANVFEELRRRVAAIPGVQSAALARGRPMEGYGAALVIEGTTPDRRNPTIGGNMWAGPGFLEMLQIPILFGRRIDERDRPGAPLVAVVSETMARRYFGSVNAVGRRFRLEQEENWIEVIGVSRDTATADRTGDLVDPEPEMFFRPFAQANLPPNTVLARTSRDAPALVGAMQRELLALDPALLVVAAQTLGQLLERSLAAPRAVAAFLGALGVLGLSLAGIGLYAVIAFAVARRTREIGIRMALGARSRDVARDVVRETAVLLAAGAGVGALLATVVILAMRSLHSPVIGFVAFNPRIDRLALVAIAAFIVIVGAAAAFVPARRAASMNPLAALRTE